MFLVKTKMIVFFVFASERLRLLSDNIMERIPAKCTICCITVPPVVEAVKNCCFHLSLGHKNILNEGPSWSFTDTCCCSDVVFLQIGEQLKALHTTLSMPSKRIKRLVHAKLLKYKLQPL